MTQQQLECLGETVDMDAIWVDTANWFMDYFKEWAEVEFVDHRFREPLLPEPDNVVAR